jgi:hypothetical protein
VKIYRSQFINGVICDVVLASDAEELEKENAKLRDDITSLRVQLGAIGEFVKDRVNTALGGK